MVSTVQRLVRRLRRGIARRLDPEAYRRAPAPAKAKPQPKAKARPGAAKQKPPGDPIERRMNRLVTIDAERMESRIRGTHDATCPICGYHGRFGPYGVPTRLNACCPSCNSKERHRLVRLYADRHLELTPELRVLHLAPEGPVRPHFEERTDYVAADLVPKDAATVKADIEALEFADESFDLVICCEVLEHVDDARALPELYRVLRPGGVALITTPVIFAWDETYENPEVIGNPHRQYLHFGQANHVRYYGRDIVDRIAAAGFDCSRFVATEPDVLTHALQRGETVFVCAR